MSQGFEHRKRLGKEGLALPPNFGLQLRGEVYIGGALKCQNRCGKHLGASGWIAWVYPVDVTGLGGDLRKASALKVTGTAVSSNRSHVDCSGDELV